MTRVNKMNWKRNNRDHILKDRIQAKVCYYELLKLIVVSLDIEFDSVYVQCGSMYSLLETKISSKITA
jgi:hypothetical protein